MLIKIIKKWKFVAQIRRYRACFELDYVTSCINYVPCSSFSLFFSFKNF